MFAEDPSSQLFLVYLAQKYPQVWVSRGSSASLWIIGIVGFTRWVGRDINPDLGK